MYASTFVNVSCGSYSYSVPKSGQNAQHASLSTVQPQCQPLCLTSGRLHDLGWAHLELRAEDSVPEAAGHAEAILIVGEVVLEMVLLELLVVGRESGIC